jgi:putative endonuclease
MYYVYILYSESLHRFYTGSTENIETRLLHHNGGYNRSTKAGRPWKVVKIFEVNNRNEALQLELSIKKRGARRFLEDIKA